MQHTKAVAAATALQDIIRDAAETPFDLAQAPLMRATLVRLAQDEHVLVLVFHHIIADGWSIAILTRELRELYAGRTLPPLPIQYADFAAWQRTSLQPDIHRQYWQQQLAGATPTLNGTPASRRLSRRRPAAVPPRRTPDGRERDAPCSAGETPAFPQSIGGHIDLELDATRAARLRERSRAIGVTLHVALFSAYATLLYRLSAQDDLIIGTPVGNRPRPELEPLVGLFLNVLPIRVRISAHATFDQLCRDVHATTLDAFAHDELPLEQIVAAAQWREPLQAMFVLQNTPTESLSLPGVTIEPVPFEITSAKFDLTLSISERADGALSGALEYAADVFDADTARELARAYVAILQVVADDPGVELLRIPLGANDVPLQSFSQDEDFAFGEV
jgi:non-ribosomal peptide synthetase component F